MNETAIPDAHSPQDSAQELSRALALVNGNKHREASAIYERLVERPTTRRIALFNLAACHQSLNEFETARRYLEAYLIEFPDEAGAFNNLGVICRECADFRASAEAFRQAVRLEPSNFGFIMNLANALTFELRYDEALAIYNRALDMSPNDGTILMNRSFSHLVQGKFEEGWEDYEKRPSLARPFTKPVWKGEDLTGKRLFVHAEQGHGDTIQFIRYLKLIKRENVTIFFESQPALWSILKRVEGVDLVIEAGEPIPEFDYQICLLSIPKVLNTNLATIPPADRPYITPDPRYVAYWSERLPKTDDFTVGIAWAGSTIHRDDLIRTMPLAKMAQHLDMPGVRLISCQRDYREGDLELLAQYGIEDLSDEIETFEDTAALLTRLDHVIAVDTSLGHLAAAMGRPVWKILAYRPDWRWLLNRTDTPWYKTIRLFRQNRLMDWDTPLLQVRQELEAMVHRHQTLSHVLNEPPPSRCTPP